MSVQKFRTVKDAIVEKLLKYVAVACIAAFLFMLFGAMRGPYAAMWAVFGAVVAGSLLLTTEFERSVSVPSLFLFDMLLTGLLAIGIMSVMPFLVALLGREAVFIPLVPAAVTIYIRFLYLPKKEENHVAA